MIAVRRHAWTIPSAYSAAALAAGFLLPRIEHRLFPDVAAALSVPAAMAIYSSVASGMIALTGIVFSLVFVMVQFSATAYSPRLVLWVARNPLIGHALGVFTATFLYALAALAWVDRHGSNLVPLVSAAMVLVLLLASMCMFVMLIERISMLNVNQMLMFTGDYGRAVINTIYPEPYANTHNAVAAPPPHWPPGPAQQVVYHGRPAAVQRLDIAAFVMLARRAGAVVEVVPAVGDTVIDSQPLINVYGALTPLAERRVRRAIVVGDERTFEQDPKYAIRLLVDIAIRALSAAINDPTTAVQALDQIGDLLARLAGRHLDIGSYRDGDGAVRVIVPSPSWEDFLRLAFDEIQTCGVSSVQVTRRLKALITDLLAASPPDRRPALEVRRARLERAIARTFTDEDDKLDASAEDRQGLGVPRRRPAA